MKQSCHVSYYENKMIYGAVHISSVCALLILLFALVFCLSLPLSLSLSLPLSPFLQPSQHTQPRQAESHWEGLSPVEGEARRVRMVDGAALSVLATT